MSPMTQLTLLQSKRSKIMAIKRKPTSIVQTFKKYDTRSKVRYTKAINDDFREKEILSNKSMKIS